LRLPVLGALALALACGRAAPRAAQPARNVVLIVLDTLRADHLSSYGYARQTSPNLDAFGRANTRFDQARSQATCTYPSVNSLLTSRSAYHFLGQERRRIGIPAKFPTLAERLRAAGFKTGAVSASSVVRRSRSEHNPAGGFDGGFDSFDETCMHKRADCVNRRARRFLNHTPEPFFLYLQYVDPHSRYAPPEDFRGRFGAPYEGPEWVKQGNAGALFGSLRGRGAHVEVTPADLQHLVDLYDAEIAYLDAQLGELLADLERRGLLENTVIAITADHGEEFLEHKMIWHCMNLYEPTLRVPLFLHVPGVAARPAETAATQNLDLVPTILDAVALPVPSELEGRSLLPLLRGQPSAPRTVFALQSEYRSASDGRFKLLANVVTGAAVLYDLAADPGETRDVATAERAAFHALRNELGQWLVRVEGSANAKQQGALAEETQKLLESLGYLR
jgi:arylsulfatase A-like enzyme